MTVSRRVMANVPRLTGRAWEDVNRDLEEFLRKFKEAWGGGIPPGFLQSLPETVDASSGSAGTELEGWAAADHDHPVLTGVPVGLGYEAEEGVLANLTRSDHVHPYLDLYEDLLAMYRLEEASGKRFPSVGTLDLLEFGGTVSSATGVIGNGAQFSGTNMLYADEPYLGAVQLGQGNFDYSICCWVYFDSVAAVQYFIAKDSGTDREYGMLYDPAGASGSGSFQAFLQTDVPNTYAVEATDIVPAIDTWYFVHYWYVHSANTIYLRINDGATFSTYCNGEDPRQTNKRFFVGARRDSPPSSYLSGRMDAIHWHQRALSEGEHDILYAGGNGREIYVTVPLTNSLLTPGGTAKASTGVTVSDIVVWEAPFNATLTNVRATRKGGTGATINMRRNYVDEHLSGDLSLVAATTTYDGGTVQNTAYTAGDIMEVRIKSVTGSPTEIAIWAIVERA